MHCATLLVSCLLLAPCLPGQKPKPAPKGAATATVDGKDGEALDAIVQGFDSAAGGFSGSVLVAKDGKVLLEKGYGLHDAEKKQPIAVDALWDWASVSKQFTATALLRLQEKKKLKLDDELEKFWQKAPADKKGVTVRHLLNHTSGIEAGFKSEWKFDSKQRSSFEELVLGLPMTSKPGEKFDYSNSGYAMAAALIEKLTGKTFEEYCVEEVFKPAGMKDACFIGWSQLDLDRVPKIARGAGFADRPKEFRFAYGNEMTWGYRGCGGTVATTRDMLAWDRALRGGKFLSKKSLDELYAPAKGDYALGWVIRNTPHGKRAEHSGGVLGVVTQYFRLLDRDVVVALACNYEVKDNPAKLAEQLVAAVLK
ncbi:MAG TPA: serine hydrolase domain-containing protein [Planctomycetota bacterium]